MKHTFTIKLPRLLVLILMMTGSVLTSYCKDYIIDVNCSDCSGDNKGANHF